MDFEVHRAAVPMRVRQVRQPRRHRLTRWMRHGRSVGNVLRQRKVRHREKNHKAHLTRFSAAGCGGATGDVGMNYSALLVSPATYAYGLTESAVGARTAE